MASRYWVSAVSSNWNNTANWSTSSGGSGGASVPGASDDVFFDGSGLGDCVIDAAVNVQSIYNDDTYTGHFDNATNNQSITVGTGGFLFFRGSLSM